MKRPLAILTLIAAVFAGSTAIAATYENPYDDFPEWAEDAFISEQ